MDFTHFLPLLKMAAIFAAMIAGVRFRLGLDVSILAGCLLLGLLFGMTPVAWLGAAGTGVGSLKALLLSAIVGLILVLSTLLDATGQAARFMDAMRTRLRGPRLSLAFFPALIGLLPMPGGAVFSAPMVKNVSKDMGVPPEHLAALNYWYRHVWEFCWPLYPGIILAASLADMEVIRLLLYACPGSLILLLTGWIFLLRPGVLSIAQAVQELDAAKPREPLREVAKQGLPLITAIAGAIGLEAAMAVLLPGLPHELGILAALFAAISVTLFQNRSQGLGLLKAALKWRLVRLVFVVAAVYVFKEILGASGAIEQLAALAQGPLALFIAATVLPFLAGMIGGIAIAFAGAAFPLMIALVDQSGHGYQLTAYMVLGWFSGFSGVMASPMHICFLLTCQYFQIDMAKVWRKIAPACLVLMVTGVLYFLLLLAIIPKPAP